VRHVETIGGRDQLGDGGRVSARPRKSAPSRASARSSAGLKDPHRQRFVADRFGPLLVLGLQVEEVPRGTAECKDLGTFGEDLDLTRGLSTAQTCPCCSVARACG
jgi:hypothetical protein